MIVSCVYMVMHSNHGMHMTMYQHKAYYIGFVQARSGLRFNRPIIHKLSIENNKFEFCYSDL